MFYTTDIIEVTRQTGLTLTWQEAEERHEHHCQEAEGGNPGESLLAPHRAHLGFSNFTSNIMKIDVYIDAKKSSTMFSIVGNRKNTSETPS